MDERLIELLAKIESCSDEELVEIRDIVTSLFEGTSNSDLESLEALAAAATAVTKEQKRRDGIITRSSEARELLASFRRTAVVPADRRPRRSGYAGNAYAVTASGSTIPHRTELAAEFVTAMRTQRAPNSQDGRTLVATLHADRVDGAMLRQNDSSEMITASLDAAARAHVHDALTAITAAGGIGAPEDNDYVLPGFETTDRPVKAALPRFTAERGGVRFMRPPTLTDVNGAIGIWTVPDDIEAVTNAAVRKPSLRATVGDEVIVDVQAITNTLVFGNMQTRAYPEFVARVIDLAFAAHARLAEQQTLTQIGALSTSVSGLGSPAEGGGLGATRVLLPLLDRAATGMRDRLRMGTTAPLQLILPHWARGILRSDLALQEPGDATLGVSDADLAGYLSSRFLSPTWALDGEAGQQFNPQAPGAVNAWPTSIVSYLFPAGAFQFLDGGTLDLGLVRDSVLNAANDYTIFSETFEAVLFRGGEAFRISQAVTPSGIARAAA